MNEQEYMNITSKIDEKYVAEYKIATAKRNITIRKRIRTAVIAAAAAAIMIPAGVLAYKQLTHRDNLKVYFSEDGVKLMDEKQVADGYTVENGKIRLTVDVQMCDGNYIYGVYTLTALTDDAKNHLLSRSTRQVYGDTGEWISPGGGGSQGAVGKTIGDDEISVTFTYDAHNAYIDESRPRRMEFFEYVETGEIDEYAGMIVERDYTYYEGISFEMKDEPNVPTKTLRSSDGIEITLSPYGVSRLDETWTGSESESMPIQSIILLGKNGGRTNVITFLPNGRVETDLEDVNISSSGNIEIGDFYIQFGMFFDVDSISGVEINGVSYMES